MLQNIILEITADKKARNIEPTHATYKEVYAKAVSKGLSVADVRNGLTSFIWLAKLK